MKATKKEVPNGLQNKAQKHKGGFRSDAKCRRKNPAKKSTDMKLIEEDRVNFACMADYREDKEMFKVVKRVLDKIKADYDFERLLSVHKKKSVR